MVLVFYSKGILEKVTMQRAQQFSAFSLLQNVLTCEHRHKLVAGKLYRKSND